MQLREYLKKEKITQEQFAEMIGVTQGIVTRWCRGAIPRIELMTKILVATQGKVTANDFYYGKKEK